eukprot:CAMPEP_0178700500 /NCGR_PEP_ID=MMETSP0699-20121125/11711_1 /TAXON_ID=265572 /ORGANISM="Extubocellulus spinifer, Strain CCMP396" /LENGTH=60 /DNA_ID=CAMNT_0020346847 /DNA_START=304 /DNA_END=486 /DNA_ORIENTATION=-
MKKARSTSPPPGVCDRDLSPRSTTTAASSSSSSPADDMTKNVLELTEPCWWFGVMTPDKK